MSDHHHSNSEPQTHSHAPDYAEHNKEYFDQDAVKVAENPQWIEMASRVRPHMLKAYPFDEGKTTVLDFACGPGFISRELAPYAKSIVGVDISQGMVDQYNLRVSNQGIPPEEMKAVCVDLKGKDGELDNAKFDIAVCTMSFHHFSSVESVARTIALFLKPGGTLLITDILKDSSSADPFTAHGSDPRFENIVAHKHGFDQEEITKIFEGAGVVLISFARIFTAKMHGVDAPIFLAKAEKPL